MPGSLHMTRRVCTGHSDGAAATASKKLGRRCKRLSHENLLLEAQQGNSQAFCETFAGNNANITNGFHQRAVGPFSTFSTNLRSCSCKAFNLSLVVRRTACRAAHVEGPCLAWEHLPQEGTGAKELASTMETSPLLPEALRASALANSNCSTTARSLPCALR